MRSSSSSSEIARARISFCDKLSKSFNGNVSYSRGYCCADRGASRCQWDSPRPSVREELLFLLFRYLLPTLSERGRDLVAVGQSFQKCDEIVLFLVRQPKVAELFLVESVNVGVVIGLLLSSEPASPRQRGAS